MKTNKYFLFTCKNNYNTNNYVYNLMFKAGLIRKLSSGIYIWLPNGYKIISNIINIIKFYMNKLNGIELYIPILQNDYLFKKSNRYHLYGKELFNLYNRNKQLFILSPTNEEIITYMIGNELKNNNFPFFFYQIQTKFRDEIRPRYNILRSKEFIMKEAYSFHYSKKCLYNFYNKVIKIYKNIFNYIGINYFYKKADNGNIGGNISHEFHIKSLYGDNKLYFKKKKKVSIKEKKNKLIRINKKKLFYLIKNNNFIKTILVKLYFKNYKKYLFILIPINYKINLIKLNNIFPLVKYIKFISNKSIIKKFNINRSSFSFWGYLNQIIADKCLLNWKNFIIGSNINNYLYININWYKNINISGFYDLCNNLNSLVSENINFKLNKFKIKTIEIAHIFNLMDCYSKIFIKKYLFNNKKIYMGSYGIGITRLLFGIIEYYGDKNKLVFPLSISHFKLGILPINIYKFKKIYDFSFRIYKILINNNIEVLIDDRELYFGEMIKDLEVIGIPNIIIISKKLLSLGLVEFRDRLNNIIKYINKKEIINYLLHKYKNYKNIFLKK